MNRDNGVNQDGATGPKDALAFMMALAGLQNSEDDMEVKDFGVAEGKLAFDHAPSVMRKTTK